MKKLFEIMIATMVVFALVACGEKPSENSNNQQNVPIESSTTSQEETKPATTANSSQGIAPSTNGTLTITKDDIAVVINGTSVKMPYKLKELEAAGVPADESRNAIELGAGDFFSPNLYLDENEDYLLIPHYYNEGDASINIADAEAKEITMTSYAGSPVDNGVSILGVSFGMTKTELKTILGEPSLDDGSSLEWHIEIPEMAYEGTLSIYLTSDSDDAVVSQVDLTVSEK